MVGEGVRLSVAVTKGTKVLVGVWSIQVGVNPAEDFLETHEEITTRIMNEKQYFNLISILSYCITDELTRSP